MNTSEYQKGTLEEFVKIRSRGIAEVESLLEEMKAYKMGNSVRLNRLYNYTVLLERLCLITEREGKGYRSQAIDFLEK